ncbi:MAG: NADH-quinone oxidoreductase subunit C [Verrucomicrobia bacterium]|nr:NADH-quinone oxidoreductase subunit C [Verrucomicrobiota bacterium]
MTWHRLRHLEAVERSHVPVLEIEPWVAALREKLAAGAYPVTVFGEDEGESRFRVWCVLADIAQHTLWLTSTRIQKVDARFASLANDFPAMNYFECELFEQTGIRPEHHPWLRPVRIADDWRQNGKPTEAAIIWMSPQRGDDRKERAGRPSPALQPSGFFLSHNCLFCHTIVT